MTEFDLHQIENICRGLMSSERRFVSIKCEKIFFGCKCSKHEGIFYLKNVEKVIMYWIGRNVIRIY